MAQSVDLTLVCDEADEARFASLTGFFRFERTPPASRTFHLAYDGHRLVLVRRGDAQGIWVDRLEIERRLKGPFLLGRACGLKKGQRLEVLDATGGLGIDGLALALRDQAVHLVERNPLLWALLGDLIERLGPAGTRAHLSLGDSLEMLARSEATYDVICFDPMFPPRHKKALPGKRMQYLAALLDEAAVLGGEAIELARSRARSRVVLKRRARDPQIDRPDWTIRGRAIRYDVYQGRAGGGRTGSDQPSSRMA